MKNPVVFFKQKLGNVPYYACSALDLPAEFNDIKYKIYHDGSNYVATEVVHRGSIFRKKPVKTSLDYAFDKFYQIAMKKGLTKSQTKRFVFDALEANFVQEFDLLQYVEKKVQSARRNFFTRLKRFRRKAFLNSWNFFTTITYDDKKMDELTFRFKLRKTLSNFHTRRGWKYMGVFERAPETGRLHFHALMFIPENEMVGGIRRVRDYSTKTKQMQLSFSNTFFETAFGRNDFKPLSRVEMRFGNVLSYITKYLMKTGEKIVYSRGIASEIIKKLKSQDFACQYYDFVAKFVLFDDVLESPGLEQGYRLVC